MRKSVADAHKRRILEVVNNLNEEELERVSEMLKVSEAMDQNDPKLLADEDGNELQADDETQVNDEADD